jgi:hypothetical protein
MKTVILAVTAGCLAWSTTAMADKYQLLPVITHMGVGRLDYTALLLDSAGGAFNCTAQFDAKLAKFTGESACVPVKIEGKLPSGNIVVPAAAQTFGWIPLWAIDQQSGVITFCTAHLIIRGVENVWCTPVEIRK